MKRSKMQTFHGRAQRQPQTSSCSASKGERGGSWWIGNHLLHYLLEIQVILLPETLLYALSEILAGYEYCFEYSIDVYQIPVVLLEWAEPKLRGSL